MTPPGLSGRALEGIGPVDVVPATAMESTT